MRAAIYVRVSTGQQAMQDLSIPDQIAQCEAYCNKREWEVVATFTDAGVSASTDNRHDFQAMIAEACSPSKPIDVVIVHSQSRFARNTLDLLHYTKKLEKAGVQFVSITQDIGNGDQADVLRTILGAMDEYQSKETSKHVKRSMCENARQGFWNGSQPPLGYRTYIAEKRGKKDKKKLEINPTEAEIVKRVFRLYVHGEGEQGQLGLKAIASLLNREGFTTRKGSLFMMQYIHKILTNEIYISKYVFNKRDSKTGKIKPEDQWIKLTTPRIINDIEFYAARDRLQHNHPLVTAPRIVNSSILLTGLVHCSKCNAPLRIRTGKGGAYRYYRCGKHADAGSSACSGCSMRMEKLDDIVLNTVLDRTLAPERLDELLAPLIERNTHSQRLQGERIKSLKSDKRQLRMQLDALWQQISTEELRLDSSLKSYIDKLQTKYENTSRAIIRLEYQNSTPLDSFTNIQKHNFADALRTRLTAKGQPKFRKAYLRSLLSHIEVGENVIKISGSSTDLAKLVSNFNSTGKLVPTFEQEWCTRRDSNS